MRVRCVGYEDHEGWTGPRGGKKCFKCGYYDSQIKGGCTY